MMTVSGVYDPDGDALTYTWKALRGEVPEGPQGEPVAQYIAPSTVGDDTITVVVSDGKGGVVTEQEHVIITSLRTIPTPTSTPTSTLALTPTHTPIPKIPPTYTPTPTHTSTPVPPMPTPIHTSTPVPPMPTPTATLYPAPVLIDEKIVGQEVVLEWQWQRQLDLDNNEHFDVRIYKGDRRLYLYGAWADKSKAKLGLHYWDRGTYKWCVAVIRGKHGQWEADLSPESEKRTFRWGGKPTPTPTPTRVPP